MTDLKFNNTKLEVSTDEYFKESFTFDELKAAGISFKPINNKGNGKFIVAKAGDDVISIPCGKSVTDEHTTQECSFGLTLKDNTLVAYVGSNEWL
jgi:hypothetical protein